MTQQTESRIIRKFNYQMWTFVIMFLSAFGGMLNFGYGWYKGVLTAINQNAANNTLIQHDQKAITDRVDKLEGRQTKVEDKLDAFVSSGKFQK